MTSELQRIAMLVDGDNAQASLFKNVLAEAAKYGTVTTRRIYGDWTTPQMSTWKETLHSYAFQPIQQFRYTTGKNSTDSALIIDAMDLLHSRTVTGFCIVSSDSDYTRLATRIREQGLFAMGIGRYNTPKSFVSACEVFVYTENLAQESTDEAPAQRLESPSAWTALVAQAVETAAGDDGWAFLGAVGNHLRTQDPAFDARTYGHKNLSQLVKSAPSMFDVRDSNPKGGPSVIDVRLKSYRGV